MRRNLFYSALFVGILASSFAWAADPEAAKNTATSVCAGCHGPKGISASGTLPNLAGQKAEYLAKQLRAFRDKTRTDPVMNSMTTGLKDEDIANLAAYFAGLKPCE